MHAMLPKLADPNVPDATLATLIAAGDREALAALMRRYNQRLFRTARAILNDDAEAEDAVQEAYLLASRGIEAYRGDASLSTWLVRVVANEALGRLRRRKRSAEIFRMDGNVEDEVEARDHGIGSREPGIGGRAPEQPEDSARRAQARRLLEATIDALPEAFRVVFILRAVEEMTSEETAAALGIPEATVRTRFFRARGLLREALAREIDFASEDAFSFAGARCDRIVAGVLSRLAQAASVAPASGPSNSQEN